MIYLKHQDLRSGDVWKKNKYHIYLDKLQFQVLRHLEGLTHSEDVPYYVFWRVAEWPELWYYLMNENIDLDIDMLFYCLSVYVPIDSWLQNRVVGTL